MTTPILTETVAILYFGWLWHGRSAADRSERVSSNPTDEINPLQLAPVEPSNKGAETNHLS